MTLVVAPHLVDDGAVKRCSACTQVFDSKSIADLRKSFADHVRLTHHSKRGQDVNQATTSAVRAAPDED